jgi:hypothetical protein
MRITFFVDHQFNPQAHPTRFFEYECEDDYDVALAASSAEWLRLRCNLLFKNLS